MSKLTFNWVNTTPIACATDDSVQVYVANLATGNVTIQGSADNVTWSNLVGNNLSTGVSNTTISANGIYSYPAPALIQWIGNGTANTIVVHILLKK